MPSHLFGTEQGFIYRESDGVLVSQATVIADPLPDGLALLVRPDQHDPDVERWDAAARDVRPFTDSDRADGLDEAAAMLAAEAVRLRGGS